MAPHVWDLGYRQSIGAPITRVVIEVFFFCLLALVLGFTVTLLFPPFSLEETWYMSLIYIILQIFVDAVLIYVLDTAYFALFGIDSDAFIGLTTFVNVFFIMQIPLTYRMLNVYTTYTGQEIDMNVNVLRPGHVLPDDHPTVKSITASVSNSEPLDE
jgi:hypothetical protein